MPRPIAKAIHSRLTWFLSGFVLGAAFMATPALGIVLMACAIAYLIFTSKG